MWLFCRHLYLRNKIAPYLNIIYLFFQSMGQIWNPWHGCHKISTGCSQCYVFREDAARGVSSPTTEVRKTSSFNLPLKKDRYGKLKFPSGTHFWLCFTSDLFIEEADCWRMIFGVLSEAGKTVISHFSQKEYTG